MHRIFTYGTLKRGYGNHVVLGESNFIGTTTTKPLYRMYDCGRYPCLIEDSKGVAIEGELYEVDDKTLARLDRLEGVPWLYRRAELQLEDGSVAIGYIYQQEVTDFKDCGNVWPRVERDTFSDPRLRKRQPHD